MRKLKLLKYVFLKKTKSPIQLIHFVTSKCNAKCQHCFYWKNINKTKDLTLEEIEKITKTLPDLQYLLITGGEPFLRNDLVEIIQAYYKNTSVIKVDIPTNGLLTKKIKEDCIQILEKCPNLELNVAVSIDAKKDIHDKIRGVTGCYEKAKETFFELKKLKNKYKNFKLSFISTLMAANQKEIVKFYKYVKQELKPDVFTLNLIRSTPKNPELKDVDLSYFKEILKLESKVKVKGFRNRIRKLMNEIRTKMIIDIIKKKKYISPCYSTTLTGVLSEDGNVYPCEMLSKPIANIKEFNYNFEELWKSKATKDYGKFIKKTKCFCTHECFLRINIIFNPGLLIISFIKNLLGLNNIK